MTRLLAFLTPLALTALLLSGCSGEPAAPAPAAEADPVPAPADGPAFLDEGGQSVPTREEPLQASGRTATGGCAGVGGVGGNCFNDLGDGNVLPLDPDTLAVRGTLTWTATTPATAVIGVIVLYPCGDGCWTRTEDSVEAYGESPLAIDFLLGGADETPALWFSGYQGVNNQVGWAGAALPQEFTFEGSATVLAE